VAGVVAKVFLKEEDRPEDNPSGVVGGILPLWSAMDRDSIFGRAVAFVVFDSSQTTTLSDDKEERRDSESPVEVATSTFDSECPLRARGISVHRGGPPGNEDAVKMVNQ